MAAHERVETSFGIRRHQAAVDKKRPLDALDLVGPNVSQRAEASGTSGSVSTRTCSRGAGERLGGVEVNYWSVCRRASRTAALYS